MPKGVFPNRWHEAAQRVSDAALLTGRNLDARILRHRTLIEDLAARTRAADDFLTKRLRLVADTGRHVQTLRYRDIWHVAVPNSSRRNVSTVVFPGGRRDCPIQEAEMMIKEVRRLESRYFHFFSPVYFTVDGNGRRGSGIYPGFDLRILGREVFEIDAHGDGLGNIVVARKPPNGFGPDDPLEQYLLSGRQFADFLMSTQLFQEYVSRCSDGMIRFIRCECSGTGRNDFLRQFAARIQEKYPHLSFAAPNLRIAHRVIGENSPRVATHLLFGPPPYALPPWTRIPGRPV